MSDNDDDAQRNDDNTDNERIDTAVLAELMADGDGRSFEEWMEAQARFDPTAVGPTAAAVEARREENANPNPPVAAVPPAAVPIAAVPPAAAPIAAAPPAAAHAAATPNAVFFGWRQHHGTTIWREIIQQLSRTYVDPNTRPNPNDIVTQVRQVLTERGITTYYVDKNPIRREDNGRTQLSGTWRPATEEEISHLTKKRYVDYCKPSSRRRPRIPNRTLQQYPIEARYVCLEWWRHPGTRRWMQVVQSFADNRQEYREWNNDIVDLVQHQLDEGNMQTRFLVFLNSRDQPCLSIHDGLWVPATETEILHATKEHFDLCRRKRKDPPTTKPQGSKRPSGGDGGGGLDDERKPLAKREGGSGGGSTFPPHPGPASNTGHGGGQGPSGQTWQYGATLDSTAVQSGVQDSVMTLMDDDDDDDEEPYDSDDDYEYEYNDATTTVNIVSGVSTQDSLGAPTILSSNLDAHPSSRLTGPDAVVSHDDLQQDDTFVGEKVKQIFLPKLLEVDAPISLAIGPVQVDQATTTTFGSLTDRSDQTRPTQLGVVSECFGWATTMRLDSLDGMQAERRRGRAMKNYFRFSPTCSEPTRHRMKRALEVLEIYFVGLVDEHGDLLGGGFLGGNHFPATWTQATSDAIVRSIKQQFVGEHGTPMLPMSMDVANVVPAMKKMSIDPAQLTSYAHDDGRTVDATNPSEPDGLKQVPRPFKSEQVTRDEQAKQLLEDIWNASKMLDSITGVGMSHAIRLALRSLPYELELQGKSAPFYALAQGGLKTEPSMLTDQVSSYDPISFAVGDDDDQYMEDPDDMDTTPEILPSLHVATTAAASTAAVSAATRAVIFGPVKHPSIPNAYTETWRKLLKENFSTKFDEYPIWIDAIASNMKALAEKEGGIDRFLVYVDDVHDKDHSIDGILGSGAFRNATDEEILENTKQQFEEDRRLVVTAKASTTRQKQPKHRPRRSETTRN